MVASTMKTQSLARGFERRNSYKPSRKTQVRMVQNEGVSACSIIRKHLPAARKEVLPQRTKFRPIPMTSTV